MLDERVMDFSAVQPLNVFLVIDFTLGGRIMDLSDVHPWKDDSLMVTMLGGRVMDSSALHPSKDDSLMDLMLGEKGCKKHTLQWIFVKISIHPANRLTRQRLQNTPIIVFSSSQVPKLLVMQGKE